MMLWRGRGRGRVRGGGAMTLPRLIAPVASTWQAWWTVFDATLPPLPGIAFTNVAGEDRVDSFTGQRNGFQALPAAAGNRPALAADGVFFRGKQVIQFAVTGARELQYNNAGAPIMASGKFPHIVLVGRYRGAVAPVPAAQRLYEASNGATSLVRVLDVVPVDGAVTNSFECQCGSPGLVQIGNNSATNAPFVASCSNTSIAGARFLRRLAGTVGPLLNTNAAGTSSTAAAMATFTMGGRRALATQPTDLSLAELLIFDQQLPATLEMQLVNFLGDKWEI